MVIYGETRAVEVSRGTRTEKLRSSSEYSACTYFLFLWVRLPNADISGGIQYDHRTTALVVAAAFQSE